MFRGISSYYWYESMQGTRHNWIQQESDITFPYENNNFVTVVYRLLKRLHDTIVDRYLIYIHRMTASIEKFA